MKRIPIAALVALLLLPAGGLEAGGQTSPITSSAGGREVSGVVLSGKNGQPLAAAKVSLAPLADQDAKSVVTADAEGRFVFKGVADGRYRLQAAHLGYVTASYEEHLGYGFTAIVAGEGLTTTGLKLTLPSQAIIRGNITEDSGDPVANGRVILYMKDLYGSGKMMNASMAMTNSAGDYELRDLPSGSFYLCVYATPWYVSPGFMIGGVGKSTEIKTPALVDKAYPVTCSPGVTDNSAAEAIVVGAGDRLTVNLVLHPVAAAHIFFQLPAPKEGERMVMPSLKQSIFGMEESLFSAAGTERTTEASDDKSMMYEVSGVAPGSYTANFRDSDGDIDRSIRVEAGPGATTLDSSSAAVKMVEVTGKIEMANGVALPAGVRMTVVSSSSSQILRSTSVDAGGGIHLPVLLPGDYRLFVHATGINLKVVKTLVNGAATPGGDFTVGSEPATLTVVVAQAEASVSGKAQRNGQPASGVLVLMVPTGAKLSSDAIVYDQSDSDGSFDLPEVIAGDYTLVAIQEGWKLDWARHESLTSYLRRGNKITVAPDSKKIVLKEPIETQPK
jgi:hypothetical protein